MYIYINILTFCLQNSMQKINSILRQEIILIPTYLPQNLCEIPSL